jgi:DNA-binding SARP family transcriptional activator
MHHLENVMEQQNAPMVSSRPETGPAPWLRIHTLGRFQINWLYPQSGQVVLLPIKKRRGQNAGSALGLLKALLSCPDRFAPRSWLNEQFWPNARHKTVEERLNDVVSSLRTLLRPEGCTEMFVHFVHGTDGRGAGFRLDAYPQLWCDADAFEWYVNHAILLDQRQQDSTACWERASLLAERGQYLPEQVYEEWARQKRDYLTGLVRDCAHCWTALLRQMGLVDEASTRLRSYWLKYPTDEDALRPLLDMLGERERFGEAEECYSKTQVALAEDNHVPAEHTNETIEVVRALQIKRSRLTTPSTPFPSRSLDQSDRIEAVTLLREEKDLNSYRRRFLQHLFHLVGTAALPMLPLHASVEPSFHECVSKETRALYEHVLALSWEQYIHPVPVTQHNTCRAGFSLLRMIVLLLPCEEQNHLLSLLCRFSQLSGVVARDRMDLAQACQDGKLAIELAFHLENAELIAASLFRQAKTLLKKHQIQESLDHLEAACVYAQRARAPLKGYVYQATAKASALAAHRGDGSRQQDALTLMDRAEQVLVMGERGDDGSFVRLNVAGLSLDRAGVLIHFQQFPEARSLLDATRTHPGGNLPRWQTRLLLAEAQTYLAEHNPEASSEKALQALSLLQATQSQRGLSRIASLYQQLEATYAYHGMVQRLGEQLLVGKEP